MNIFNVLSFDPNRIKLDIVQDGRLVVRKITSATEYRNIMKAHKHFAKYPLELSLGCIRVSLIPAPVIGWDESNSVLITEFIKGDNLEHILREHSHIQRRDWIVLFKQLFSKLRLSGFLWGDFAPRNMIFSKEKLQITIIDFEREQIFRDGGIKTAFFSRYVRNYSREEFSCFLLKDEQEFLFGEFLTKEAQGCIPISEIPYRRKKVLISLLFGNKEAYSMEEVEEVEDIMADIATPFLVENALFYPMDILDRIGSKGGVMAYARTAKRIKDIEAKERFNELNKLAKEYQ